MLPLLGSIIGNLREMRCEAKVGIRLFSKPVYFMAIKQAHSLV